MKTRNEIIQQLKDADQNKSGMFELGEDTMCALMDLLTKERKAAVPVAYVAHYESGALHGVCEKDDPVKMEWLKRGFTITPLYTAQSAQPVAVPVVPAQSVYHDADCDLFRPHVVQGVFVPRCCDCRAAIRNGSPEQDPDTLALAVAEKIMALTHQRHIGGDCQLLAKIQCLILDEMGLRRG